MAGDIQKIEVDKLVLDSSNPRFANLYSGKTEADIINYLLSEENAKELVDSIDKHGFYPDEILWVLKQNGNKYLVKEGNRRGAAVKALANPDLFGLKNKAKVIREVPVIIFTDEKVVDNRIREKHANPSFRAWSRIAKALEIFRLSTAHATKSEMEQVDSNIRDFMKIAHFYNKAVAIKKEAFKELVRSGGEKGGKLTIFERLFQSRDKCGYDFGGPKENYGIQITDQKLFKTYIEKVVDYLQEHPETTYYDVNTKTEQLAFLNKLGIINHPGILQQKLPLGDTPAVVGQGIPAYSPEPLPDAPVAIPVPITPAQKRGSKKTKPEVKRKGVPTQIINRINECFKLDSATYPNAKTIMTRVVFECTLKWVVENTKFDGKKKLSDSKHFAQAFFSQKGTGIKETIFETLVKKFIELITVKGKKTAFQAFDRTTQHQIIHNPDVAASQKTSQTECENLIPLIEFLLQDETELLKKLDTGKLAKAK